MMFPETIWSRIQSAASGKTTAEEYFVRSYYEPVKRFLRQRGVKADELDDLVQTVFMKIFESRVLRAADESKGRFRSFILGITKNVLLTWQRAKYAKKRGAGKGEISASDADGAETFDPVDLVNSTDRLPEFDAVWANHIMERALEKLKNECEQKGLPYFDALEKFLNERDATHESIGTAMKVSPVRVNNYIFRGKKKLKEFIKQEIASYCSSEEEYSDELNYLSQFMEREQ